MVVTKQRLEELTKQTHFSRLELDCLLRQFEELTPGRYTIDRNTFRDNLHGMFGIDDSLLMDRVFKTFDQDNDNAINFDEWAFGHSVFIKGTNDEKVNFCFTVFDLNGDGYISKEEMFQMLQKCLVKQSSEEDSEEGIKDLVDLILKKMDFDRDGRVSFADYKETVAAEPLLLEAFGQCLPSPKHIKAFLPDKDIIMQIDRLMEHIPVSEAYQELNKMVFLRGAMLNKIHPTHMHIFTTH